jgi:hypothetical protein
MALPTVSARVVGCGIRGMTLPAVAQPSESPTWVMLAFGRVRATTVAIETSKPASLSPWLGLARHYHDGTQRGR